MTLLDLFKVATVVTSTSQMWLDVLLFGIGPINLLGKVAGVVHEFHIKLPIVFHN